jgi:putative DNA primase/helicase
VLTQLRSRGLIAGDPDRADPGGREDPHCERAAAAAKTEAERIARRIAQARALYRRGLSAAGTPVDTYLRSRGITIPVPTVLRWLWRCPHRAGGYFPAMVAPIVNACGEQIAIHKTFLRSDGAGKADLPRDEQRESCGPMKGGAVRLAPHRPDIELIVAEGIETALAAMQVTGMPAWAAGCAPGLAALLLPAEVRSVIIVADRDVSGAGERAARAAKQRWWREQRQVSIWISSHVGTDANDLLLLALEGGGGSACRLMKVCADSGWSRCSCGCDR